MAAELEKLRQNVEMLSRQFRNAGQIDLADLLNADAEGFGAKARIVRALGFESFVPAVENSLDIADLLSRTPEQIAYQPGQISRKTRVYVGSLVNYDQEGRIIPIFERLGGVERIYTAFPEGEIVTSELTIGGMNSMQLQEALKRGGFRVSDYAGDMMKSRDFTTLPTPKTIRTARLPVRAMCPDIKSPTTVQMYQRAGDLGLDKCPAEVGPHQRLKDTNQPPITWYCIAMEQIADRDGNPDVFTLGYAWDGIWLNGAWTGPNDRWHRDFEIVFAFRKGV